MLTLPSPISSNCEVEFPISGSVIKMEYSFNSRNKSWYISFYKDNKPIRKGIKATPFVNLVTDENLKTVVNGDIFLHPTSTSKVVTENNFGSEFELIYISQSEKDELGI